MDSRLGLGGVRTGGCRSTGKARAVGKGDVGTGDGRIKI